MSHKKNLIPGAHKLTPEEMSRGGINGARSRKERKQVQELARAILDLPLTNDALVDAEDLPSLIDIDSANVDVKTKVIATLAVKALKGNVRAVETLLTLSGDYITRQETLIDVDANLDYDYTLTIGGDPATAHKLTYFDSNGNPIKTIYGDEAAKIAHERGVWNKPMKAELMSDTTEEQ